MSIKAEIQKHIDSFRNGDWKSKVNAEKSLIQIGAPAEPQMIGLLTDESWYMRLVAVRVLARIGCLQSNAVQTLQALLQKESDDWIRRNAEWAISEIEGRRSN